MFLLGLVWQASYRKNVSQQTFDFFPRFGRVSEPARRGGDTAVLLCAWSCNIANGTQYHKEAGSVRRALWHDRHAGEEKRPQIPESLPAPLRSLDSSAFGGGTSWYESRWAVRAAALTQKKQSANLPLLCFLQPQLETCHLRPRNHYFAHAHHVVFK